MFDIILTQKKKLQALTLPGSISICIFQLEYFVPCLFA